MSVLYSDGSDGSIKSQEYKSFEIMFAVTIKINLLVRDWISPFNQP